MKLIKGIFTLVLLMALTVACNETKKESETQAETIEAAEAVEATETVETAEQVVDAEAEKVEESTEATAEVSKEPCAKCKEDGKTCEHKEDLAEAKSCKEECAKNGKSCDGKCKA
jgi:hypothetical protein